MGVRDSQSKTPPRQITLPLRIAMRIAYQNIRMRLSRNLLVTSGILLGVAFLISTLVMDLTVRGMREWVAEAHLSPRFAVLAQEQNDLENRLAAKTAVAREDADRNRGAGDLSDAEQIQIADRLAAVRAELNSPLQLEAKLRDNGVPVTVEEIAGDRIQTRVAAGPGAAGRFHWDSQCNVDERHRAIPRDRNDEMSGSAGWLHYSAVSVREPASGRRGDDTGHSDWGAFEPDGTDCEIWVFRVEGHFARAACAIDRHLFFNRPGLDGCGGHLPGMARSTDAADRGDESGALTGGKQRDL